MKSTERPTTSPSALPPHIAALAHVGGTRRPVKIVQHPAFRGRSGQRAQAPGLTVVWLSAESTARTPRGERAIARPDTRPLVRAA